MPDFKGAVPEELKAEDNTSMLGRGAEGIKKTQIRFTMMKNTMFEKKNTPHEIDGRSDGAKEMLAIYRQQKRFKIKYGEGKKN